MGKYCMTREEIQGFLERLGEVVDIRKVLEEAKVTPRVALRALKSAYGQKYLEAQRLLREAQTGMIAERAGPEAAAMLRQIALTETKAEVRLRGVLQLLELAGRRMWEKEGAKGGGERVPEGVVNEEWMEAIAGALAEIRRRKAMGGTTETRRHEDAK